MVDSYWRKSLFWVLKANIVIWVVNSVLFIILDLFGNGWGKSGYFSKISLVEAGIFFLIGGALVFSGSVLPSKVKEQILKSNEKWSIENLRNSEKRANKYIILAVILFVECLIVSLLGV